MVVSSTRYVRALEEMCGTFHPESTEEKGRFVLHVEEDLDVPVLIGTDSSAAYPEIRIIPFFDEKDRGYGGVDYKTPGVEANGENPDIDYTRSKHYTTLRSILSLIRIYAKDHIQMNKIRDALFMRIEQFKKAKAIYCDPGTGWEEDGNVYMNPSYDSNVSIFAIYDSKIKLTKTSDVASVDGSWNLTDEGLFVNPLTEIDNLLIGSLYRGYVFADGDMMASKGILKLSITSSEDMPEKDPYLVHWEIRLMATYQDSMVFGVGPQVKQVIVNGETKE